MTRRCRRGAWIAAALVCACAKRTTAPRAEPPAPEASAPAPTGDPWSTLQSQAGRFVVQMPPEVEAERDAVATAEGKAASYSYRSFEGATLYAVFVTAYAGARKLDDPTAVLDAAQQRAMSNVGAALFATKSAELAGHPAREVMLHFVRDGREFEARARLALIDDRVYELVVIAQRGKAPAADVDRFFASFELMAPEPSDTGDDDAIRAVIRAHMPEVKRCAAYASAATDREMVGRLPMNFTIGPQGTVTACSTEETPLPAEMSRCMIEVFEALQFPRPSTGEPVKVHYPFVFQE